MARMHRTIQRRLAVHRPASSMSRGLRAHGTVSDDTLAAGVPERGMAHPAPSVGLVVVGRAAATSSGRVPTCCWTFAERRDVLRQGSCRVLRAASYLW
jgi:hypothetical protein